MAALPPLAGGSDWLIDASRGYPPLVFGAAALLAWRFRRSRALAAVAALALIGWLDGALQPVLAAAFLPLAFTGLAATKDRGAFAVRGLAQVAGLLAAVGTVAALPSVAPGLADALRSWDVLPGVGAGTVGTAAGAGAATAAVGTAGASPAGAFTDVGILTAALSLVGVVGLAWWRDDPVDRGLAWCLAAVLLALGSVGHPVAHSVHLMGAALVLTLAVLEKSYAMAYHDELTGLPARRALWQELETAGTTYAVAMVDVDHFKRFNDRHGHDVGDQVLRMVAGRLAKVSGGGRAFRYGGEEFAIIFPGKDRSEAIPHLESLRADVEQARFAVRRPGRPRKKPSPGKPAVKKPRRAPGKLQVTVSIGVAERSDRQPAPGKVVKAADRALYRAKRDGRNRVSK